MARVVLSKVSKVFQSRPGFTTLANVSIEIPDQQFVVVIGPNGCGKSTLLRLISGLDSVSSGDIFIGEQRVNDLPVRQRDVAMVFGNNSLYPNMTVFENIAFGLSLRKFPKSKIKGRVTDAASALGIERLLERKPDSLTLKQQQAVAIARAIARQPKVLLFDEPFAKLDSNKRAAIRRRLAQVRQRLQTTIIYATTDSIEAMSLGDRIVALDNGVVHQDGTPVALYDQPANVFVANLLGRPAMNLLPGELREVRDVIRFFEADNGTVEVTLPISDRAIVQPWLDKPVLLGIRPEDIELADPANRPGDSAAFVAIAEDVEPHGGETILFLETGPHRLTCRSWRALERSEAGRRLPFKLNAAKVSLFDAVSSKRIA